MQISSLNSSSIERPRVPRSTPSFTGAGSKISGGAKAVQKKASGAINRVGEFLLGKEGVITKALNTARVYLGKKVNAFGEWLLKKENPINKGVKKVAHKAGEVVETNKTLKKAKAFAVGALALLGGAFVLKQVAGLSQKFKTKES